jgi:hypothetical protein
MGRYKRNLGSALAATLLLAITGPAAGQEPAPSTTRPNVTRHSFKELRDRYVVRQALDYSCGAAALATLMRYYFDEPVSEAQILKLLVSGLNAEELRLKQRRGFSLLDLKNAAEALGYRAAGFRLTSDDLAKLATPVIVFIEPFEYKHFAVYRGVSAGRIFLADPARGNVRMTIERFLTEWTGIVFVLGKPGEEAIRTHRLALPRADDADPPLRSVNPLSESGAASLDVSRRSRLPGR